MIGKTIGRMTQKEDKKRKRQSNGVPKPNKKTHVDGEASGTVKVTIAEEGLPPAIGSAPGLTIPSLPFKAFAKSTSQKERSSAYPKPSTHDLLLHSTRHPRLDYTGTPSNLDGALAHYVAVFDPQTQRLRLAPAHHLNIRSTLRSENQAAQDNQKRTLAQQREALGQEFGTKKAKKMIASRTENAITKGAAAGSKPDELQSAILDSMADTTANNQNEAELAEAALAAKPIPKPHMAASSVEEVYPLTTLIPPSDLRLVQVKEWQEKARADEAIMFNNRFPAHRVGAIGKSDNTDKLKALRYLTLLLDFHAALSNAGRSGKKVPKKDVLLKKLNPASNSNQYPENMIDSVRRRFSENNELNKWHMDYLYTHMCALSLYVDDWVTDISNLKDDLRLENKQVAQYFSELGCRVNPMTETERERKGLTKAQANATRVAKLKLPLEFPRARVVRRR